MKTRIGICGALVGTSLMSCSVVPTLEQATGEEKPAILISQIVERVKCELSDSFDARIDDEQFRWLQSWTAKVDLTVQINDQGGVSPSGSYTAYQKNAFNYAAGSTSLTTTAIQAVNQSFTLSVGGGYNEQAQRSETVSFAVSLREMKDWRSGKLSYRGKYPEQAIGDTPHCSTIRPELRGYLGLKEWIDSALTPIEIGQLHAGIHPDPVNTPSKPAGAPAGAKGFRAVDIDINKAKARVDIAVSRATSAASAARKSATAVADSAAKIQAAKGKYIDPFMEVLAPDLKRTVTLDMNTLAKALTTSQADAKDANAAKDDADKIKREVTDAIDAGKTVFPEDQVKQAEIDATDADNFASNASAQKDGAAKIEDDLTHFKPNPPIDGLLHSVQFVLAYNASITPNWSLLLWKGPGLTLPGASLSGTRTHILNIALGSPTEQARLIQNITIANTGPH